MKNKGFTLVELLAVIVVLAIIALIGYSTIGGIIQSVQDSSDQATIREYAKGVEKAKYTYLASTGKDINSDSSLFPEDWLDKNVKLSKSSVSCNKVSYSDGIHLNGCKVNNGEKTYCYKANNVYECDETELAYLSRIYGNSIQNGTPSPDSPVEIQSVGERTKNLLSYPYFEGTKTINGITFTDNGDGSITVNGTATSDSAFFTEYIKLPTLVGGKQYRISCLNCSYNDGTSHHYQMFISDADIGFNTYAINSGTTLSFDEDTNLYLKFAVYKGVTVNNLILKPQLEEGITTTSYEPYGYKIPITVSNGTTSETRNIYLDEPLRKIGDYADYIDLENGKVVRNIKEIIINGSENWNYTSNIISTSINNYLDNNSIIMGLCSHYNAYSYSSLYSIRNNADAQGFGIGGRIRIVDNVKFGSDVTAFKTWLVQQYNANNPLKVNYVLATPSQENISLPELPKLEGNVTYSVDTEPQPSKIQ